MPPKITDSIIWQQAELLMQPAFIRIVDNIRKLLDVSPWTGTYQDVLIWSADVSEETKNIVTSLLQELEVATPEAAESIRETLSDLPVPHPGYHLCLQRQEQRVNVDLWDLCYQVCFLNYASSQEVTIDTSLFDESGEVDWQLLDRKSQDLVSQIFGSLPDC
ncbi:hypothetical protein [Calothrix sp. 336/3]|uniref:hypothetical protein n=1 Tax=Calothrix sp. 336/3 TaxID=1337936 RepID=UPI0004E2A410|nr:hypothetical protein [Calothrix sp. 336/3]AKG24698.1 hypothetical protein IJ00_17140 [Calothrix sp. 336/3]